MNVCSRTSASHGEVEMRRIRVAIVGASLVLGCGPGKAAETNEPRAARRGLELEPNDRAAIDVRGVYERSHAVVIGIDHYQHVTQLGGAVRDAKAVAQVLEGHGFEVTMLLDEQATRGAIAEELGDRLHGRAGPNDRVIVFFAGHGVSTGDGDHRMGYLLPIEGKRDAVRATSLSMSELQNWLAGYSAKHVMFVADACYSGLALSTRSTGLAPGTATYLQEVTSRKVRFTLVAGMDDQEAHEDAQSGHGVFTRFLLEGLSGAADANRDGLVTSDELSVYVKPQVSTYVSQNFNLSQTPQSARSGMGELVFFVANTPAATAAVAPPTRENPPPAQETIMPAAPTVAPTTQPAPSIQPSATTQPAATTQPTPTPDPAPPPKAASQPKTAVPALPEGVEIEGDVIRIVTTSAPAHRGNLVKAKADAVDAQRWVIEEALAGPPFNVPRGQIEARIKAILGAMLDESLRKTRDGDVQVSRSYRLR
jgi:uncharacterized caspase-like protein